MFKRSGNMIEIQGRKVGDKIHTDATSFIPDQVRLGMVKLGVVWARLV